MAVRLSGTLRRIGALALGAVWLSACSSESPAISSYQGIPVSNPALCRDMVNATLEGFQIQLNGKQAGCSVDGLKCPLFTLAAFDQACGADLSYARCEGQAWRLVCVTPPPGFDLDASAPTADAAAD